ncbi:MAG: hypothetical protein JWQ25_560 [Daejeonella sp.]|nr:hypothetical protein [Daejeonella sp.]
MIVAINTKSILNILLYILVLESRIRVLVLACLLKIILQFTKKQTDLYSKYP